MGLVRPAARGWRTNRYFAAAAAGGFRRRRRRRRSGCRGCGASVPWIVGGALIGAGLGTGIATLGNQGQAHGPPSGESFNDFLANPPGAERTWRNPANDDHGTVTIAAETRAADGTLCKRLSERMWLTGSGEQEVDATACQRPDGSWQITDIEPQIAALR